MLLLFETALMNKQRKRNVADEVKAYHLIQSFAKTDEISPEQAHEMGLEMMSRYFTKSEEPAISFVVRTV